MATITLHIPDDAPLAALHSFADQVGCVLRRLPDGSYAAVRREEPSNVVQMPQRFHRTRPVGDDGPEAA